MHPMPTPHFAVSLRNPSENNEITFLDYYMRSDEMCFVAKMAGVTKWKSSQEGWSGVFSRANYTPQIDIP